MKKILKKILNLNTLFWSTYTGLLIVMLPHTAFIAYRIFDDWLTAIAFATVFELSIFGFSASFKNEIENSRRLRLRANETELALQIRKFKRQYINVYFFGLIITALLSGLANFTYAVEFWDDNLKTIILYDISPTLYHIGFGLILPAIAVLFSFVLAKNIDEDTIESKENETIKRLKSDIDNYKSEMIQLNKTINELSKSSDSVKLLNVLNNDSNKEKRLIAAFTLFPKLNNSGAAIIAKCDPSYVTSRKKAWSNNAK